MASAGGYYTGGGNSLSWTMGETFTTTLTAGNNKLTQGFQQPEIRFYLVNLKAFIEGFYIGGSMMKAVVDPLSQPLITDTIILSLAESLPPYNIVQSATTVLYTDGNAQFDFPVSVSGQSYYLVLNHRNSIETWSALPVTIKHNMMFDFTSY